MSNNGTDKPIFATYSLYDLTEATGKSMKQVKADLKTGKFIFNNINSVARYIVADELARLAAYVTENEISRS